MADSSDDDIFADSADDGGDTDELISASNKSDSKPIAKKKKAGGGAAKSRLKRMKDKNIPDADNGSDDEGDGLFDSDDDEKESTKKKLQTKSKQPLSKRARLEAQVAKRRAASGADDGGRSKKGRSNKDGSQERDKGYDSGDSYNSGEFVEDQDDTDFIDRTGEDEELLKEYDREQHFDDERPDYEDDMEAVPKKHSKKNLSTKRGRGPDSLSEADKADTNNPVMAAVQRMKKKKKVTKKLEELREEAVEFLQKMESAADHDDVMIKERKPGLKKLKMLPEVLHMLANRDMTRSLLEADVLISIKRWIQPLKNGQLGNITIRRKLIDAVSNMSGEDGIDTDDLKRSDFGKVVMALFMHKKEPSEMKEKHNALIQTWSRIIFKKDGDMRNLGAEQSRRRRETGLTAISRANTSMQVDMPPKKSAAANRTNGDIEAAISKGRKQTKDLGRNRVRIPYSKGFQFTVRPANMQGDVTDSRTRITNVKPSRDSLHKRMLEKKRTGGSKQKAHSANISLVGRAPK